eukprot:scaffold17835_cov129-Isochrysis_galbana.AAC.2
MESDTTAYKQVGKMFLQTPIDDLKGFLDTKTERCIKECDALAEKRSHVTLAAEKLQEDFQQFVKDHIYQHQAGTTA